MIEVRRASPLRVRVLPTCGPLGDFEATNSAGNRHISHRAVDSRADRFAFVVIGRISSTAVSGA